MQSLFAREDFYLENQISKSKTNGSRIQSGVLTAAIKMNPCYSYIYKNRIQDKIRIKNTFGVITSDKYPGR